MRRHVLSAAAVFVLALSQMGGCDVRFNGADGASTTDPNQQTTGRGTTTDQTIDISNLRLTVNGSSLGEVMETNDVTGETEVFVYGSVTNTSGVALAGIRVEATLRLANGGEKTSKVPLKGQTVSRNDKTATQDKIVTDGLYATATGFFRIKTGEASLADIHPVTTSDFAVTFADAGVSEPESRVIFQAVTSGTNPTEATNESTRLASGTVENDADLTVFHATVVYAFKASDGTMLGIAKQVVSPSDGGTDETLAGGATGTFQISVDTTDLGPLTASNSFLIQWAEEK
jgi:hypothetical protein